MAQAINHRIAAVKAVVLVVFVVTALVLVHFTPVWDSLTAEKLATLLEIAGLWAPVVYVLLFAVGVCLFVPGVVLVGLGAAIFGPLFGFLYGWFGAMLGCSVAFFVGRYLGRDFAASLVTGKLKEYDDKIEKNGFATVLYLRLAWMPFSPMSYGMGLTKVRFWDYFCGTALGIIAAVFIITSFVGAVKEVWASGHWEEFLSWKIVLAVILLIFSVFIPKVIERVKATQRIQPI